jgi:Protein of unknown function (DUF1565)
MTASCTDTIDMSTKSGEYGRMTSQTEAHAASITEQKAMTATHILRSSGRSRPAIAFALGAALALLSMAAEAATYYVATTGNDNNAGTQASPWRTIQGAANKASAGDTVLVAGGTYAEKVTFPRSGAAGQPITFQAVSGQTPVIDASGLGISTYGAAVILKGVGYIRLDGFEVSRSGYYGIYIGGEAHHLQIVNCNVHDSGSSGIWIEGPLSRPSMSLIGNNQSHNNAQGGITVWQLDGGYLRIEGNQTFSNTGTGNYDAIQVGGGNGGAHHVVVRNNISHDNGQADTGEDNLDLGGHKINHHYLVEGNQVYGGTGSVKLHSGDTQISAYTAGVSGYHIFRFNQITGKGYVSYEFPNPIVSYNNTFVDCGQCFMIYGENGNAMQSAGDSTYTGGDAGRMNWKNNLFFQSQASSQNMLLTASPSSGTIDVRYNSVRFQSNLYGFSSKQQIAWGAAGLFTGLNTASGFASYQNSYGPNYPDVNSGITTAAATSVFTSYGTRDYHLAAGSPAIDAGRPLTFATNAGTNATQIKVDRASYFQDGYCTGGECLYTPDTIVVGSNPPVQIVSVDDVNNVITLAQPITWLVGAAVTLPYVGQAPDVGAFEYGSVSTLAPPSNVRVINVQ